MLDDADRCAAISVESIGRSNGFGVLRGGGDCCRRDDEDTRPLLRKQVIPDQVGLGGALVDNPCGVRVASIDCRAFLALTPASTGWSGRLLLGVSP